MRYQYDLFISFKNSTEKGLTQDRDIAKKFYDVLSDNNLKVFFSNRVLSDKGIDNYMLEIQSALEEAKAILVVYSDPSFIAKGWVAQEWMTFLNLLLRDANRSIYVYSIKNDTTDLPPFLRPYQCFGNFESALVHIKNGHCKENKNDDEIITIGKRNFLNAYWNLFGILDFNDYAGMKMIEDFPNYEVYCLRYKYISGLSEKEYSDALIEIVSKSNNSMACYLLSRYFRDYRHLDLEYSRKLANCAFKKFTKDIVSCNFNNTEIELVVLCDEYEYDGAFYMCEAVYDVLDAYNVTTCIKVVNTIKEKGLENVFKMDCRFTVLFWSSPEITLDNTSIDFLYKKRDAVLIGLNAFSGNSLPLKLKECEKYENGDEGITKLCRALLS